MVGGERIHRILPKGATAGDAKRLTAELRSAAVKSAKLHRAATLPGDLPMTGVLGLYVVHAAGLRSADPSAHHAKRLGPWAEKYMASQAREFAAHVIRDMGALKDGKPIYAPATVNRSLATAKKGLALAWEQNLTPENYGLRIKSVKANNAREAFLSVEQMRRIASFCAPQAQAATGRRC